MAIVALTPRVRVLVVCDEVIPSDLEAGVFHLEGVRQYRRAGAASFQAPLSLFLVLSCPRRGDYPGWIVLIEEDTELTVSSFEFTASLEEDNELLPLSVDLGEWPSLEPGRFRFEVWLSDRRGGFALKAECPFFILPSED
jgi:hypothetical protein